jgi:hypothetical protein
MVRDLVRALKKKPSRKGGKLAPRTVLNIYGALQTLFATAVEDGKVAVNPCKLTGKTLPVKRDKDPTFRDDAIFELPEVLPSSPASSSPGTGGRLLRADVPRLHAVRGGLRAALEGLRPALKPRGKLKVLRSYNTRHKLVKGTKAERPRHVPVVQLLAKMLAEWKLEGWREMYGRLPGPEDLIVPSRS